MKRPYVIGIAGGTGSGKSTLVRHLKETFGSALACLAEDSYYRAHDDLPPEERARLNYDCPEAMETPLMTAHLDALCRGEAVDVPVYDYTRHTRAKETEHVCPAPVIAAEGILLFADAALRSRFDLRVFIEADADVRILRRMERDVTERGRDMHAVIVQYLETVKPMHETYVEPTRIYADLIIPQGGENRIAADLLEEKIRAVLCSRT